MKFFPLKHENPMMNERVNAYFILPYLPFITGPDLTRIRLLQCCSRIMRIADNNAAGRQFHVTIVSQKSSFRL